MTSVLVQLRCMFVVVYTVDDDDNDYYYYIHLTAFFQDNLGKPAPER